MRTTVAPGGDVAIVATALRLPGAECLEEYWARLLAGDDCIARGDGAAPPPEPGELMPSPGAHHVVAYGALARTMAFDPERFGMSPAEAMRTDPQQRLLLELVDEALHEAALSTSEREGTAVFVGTGASDYAGALRRHCADQPGIDEAAVELGTARDYVAGKLAHRLNLRGPAVNVMAACSTGLVCTHLAVRSLQRHECDVAVAGVATLRYPRRPGYWAAPGSISAPDGVCRPFDARASGSVPADGSVVIVLRRASDAVAAGDHVLAVIRGCAMNNDGAKVGFANVRADAQMRVIAQALRAAEVGPDEIAYVEGHGTGTRLGDAVEWAALHELFGSSRTRTLVGSVKGHLGHTREAAGLAGLVKAALCLRHQMVPATANFDSLPADLVYPDCSLMPVSASTSLPHGASGSLVGVSAFGLGGTNCHAVLGPAPRHLPTRLDAGAVVHLSSHRSDTLDEDTAQVGALLREHPNARADLAWRSRRRGHRGRLRRYLRAGGEPEDLAPATLARRTRRAPRRAPNLVFAFPGVGSEYHHMGDGLAARFEVYRRSRDRTVALAAAAGIELGGIFGAVSEAPRATEAVDLRRLLRRGSTPHGARPWPGVAARHLALFATQIALCDLLESHGLSPAAVVGHSVGEWTAATIAGVLDREDAVRWIALRAQLIEQAPGGQTLAVATGAEQVGPLLSEGSTLAADNSPNSCTVSGTFEAVTALESRLDAAGFVSRRVGSSVAFHNASLCKAARALKTSLTGFSFGEATVPIASGLTGGWLGPNEIDATYWESQLVSPVRFREALWSVAERHAIVLELGPGNITPWVTHLGRRTEAIRTFPGSYEGVPDVAVYPQALAELWLRGCEPVAYREVGGDATPNLDWRPALRRRELEPIGYEPSAPRPPTAAEHPPEHNASVAGTAEPRDALGERLAELWCALLGVADVGPDDHFFDLGGDSLLGRHLIAELERTHGVRLPGSVVFHAATLAGMTASIRNWMAKEDASDA